MKIFTSACLVASLFLCFVFMYLMAQAGNRHLPRVQKLAVLPRLEVTLVLIVFCVVGATVGSIMIVRAARKVYREEAMENMQALIELSKAQAKKDADA